MYLLLVRVNRELGKDVLTCRPLENSVFKSCHPDDTDDPDAVGVSSEDEAEGMEDILGISRRLNRPPPSESSPPEPPAPPAPEVEEGFIKVPKKDLKRAQGILKDTLAGRKVRASGATREDVPFEVPEVHAGETSCELCCQCFKSTISLCHHMKTHTGDTGWSCDQCGKVLASGAMFDLHQKSCGKEKGHWCQECTKGYSTKQALVAHLKAKHGPPPTVEQLTCPTCSKVFKLVKTMREHMASHKGPFFCRVEGCNAGPFALPKCLNHHMEERHSFSGRKQ